MDQEKSNLEKIIQERMAQIENGLVADPGDFVYKPPRTMQDLPEFVKNGLEIFKRN